MGLVHYIADLPRCLGECHHGQGRSACTSPDLCSGALERRHSEACRAQLDEIRAAQMAGLGMACAATTSPAELGHYWPWGPSRPGKLTEAELDRHNAERHERRTLPQLLLAKGAMTAAPAPTLRERLARAWLDFRIRRMGRP